jgi:urea transporter
VQKQNLYLTVKQSIMENPINLVRIKVLLKGLGQVMLQENAITGLLFLAGIFCGSLEMGMAAMLAVVTGTCTARLLRFDKGALNSGLYGFSAALVGVALACMYQSSVLIWIAIITGAALAAVTQHFFIVRSVPVFTFPFILVTWLFLLLAHLYPGLAQPRMAGTGSTTYGTLVVLSRGFGQVMFQDNLMAGILFFTGVLISRPLAAMYALGGVVISAVIACWMREPAAAIAMGLFSYNAVLCAVVFAGGRLMDGIWALIAVVLSVLVLILLNSWNIPALTFPFVLATWLTLLLQKLTAFFTGQA